LGEEHKENNHALKLYSDAAVAHTPFNWCPLVPPPTVGCTK
jgi:hypothetical protein